MDYKKYFDETENGDFLINGKWHTPIFGCDTIQHIIDDESFPLEAEVIVHTEHFNKWLGKYFIPSSGQHYATKDCKHIYRLKDLYKKYRKAYHEEPSVSE